MSFFDTQSLQENSDRTWQLNAASPEEAEQWVDTINTQKAQRYKNGMLASAENEEQEIVDGFNVWLGKKGQGAGAFTGEKKRLFVLAYGSK